MPVTFRKESDGLIVINLNGVFKFSDLEEIQNKARAAIDNSQKIRALILAEKFAGWGKEGDWGDLTFMYEYDGFIEKMAVIADGKWRDQLLMFLGEGRRQALIKFFLPDGEKYARDWLKAE